MNAVSELGVITLLCLVTGAEISTYNLAQNA